MTENHPCVVTDAQPQQDGVTFVPDRDGERLTRQHHRVFALMKDGRWRTLAQIATFTGDPEASVSARLRDCRKAKFAERYGSYALERRYVKRGLHEYRLVLNRTDLWS